MVEIDSKGLYKKASIAIDNWLELHKGETFDLDLICRQLNVNDPVKRNIVTQKLAYEVKTGLLEKNNRVYRYIDNTIKYIDWVNSLDKETLNIIYPYSREDDTHFGFDEHIVTSPGDVIVIAGGSNYGKTTFCLNLLWNNMDTFQCTLMGNEYSGAKFKRRTKKMTWADPLNEDGTSKFELIDRRDNWKDIIRPDNINIIDWIQLPDNFYQIGSIIDGIQSKLRNGIAVVTLQKAPGKEIGLGGGFSEHLSSLYLIIDYERLTVRKAKEWHGENPNGKMYGFMIVESGTQFHNIREIRKCPSCYTTGKHKGEECERCEGRGYIDV